MSTAALTSATVVGVVILFFVITLMYRRSWMATRANVIFMFLGGWALQGGFAGNGLDQAISYAATATSSVTAAIVGTAVPLVLLAFQAAWIYVDLKDQNVDRFSPWLAMILPTTLSVVGGMSNAFGNGALSMIGDLMVAAANLVGHLADLFV